MAFQNTIRPASYHHILLYTMGVQKLSPITSRPSIIIHIHPRPRTRTRTRTRSKLPCRRTLLTINLQAKNSFDPALSVTQVQCRNSRSLVIILFQLPTQLRPHPMFPLSHPITLQPCVIHKRRRCHITIQNLHRLLLKCPRISLARSVETKPWMTSLVTSSDASSIRHRLLLLDKGCSPFNPASISRPNNLCHKCALHRLRSRNRSITTSQQHMQTVRSPTLGAAVLVTMSAWHLRPRTSYP